MRQALQFVAGLASVFALGYAMWLVADADLTSRLERAAAPPSAQQNAAAQRASSGSLSPTSAAPGEVRKRTPRSARTDATGPEATRLVALNISPAAKPTAAKTRQPLAIEVARINTDTVSVLAGRAPPDSRISILANGREVASAIASAEGQWSVIVLEGFKPGSVTLLLKAQRPGEDRQIASAPAQLELRSDKPASLLADWNPSPGAKDYSAPAATAANREVARFAALVGRARREAAMGAHAHAFASALTTASLPQRASSSSQPGAGDDTLPTPVPITFESNADIMTREGREAAALLAEFLRIRQSRTIALTGHADNRGSDAYNFDLSRRRLEAIERYLRAAGFTGRLVLVPKGRSQPYQAIDRSGLSQEARWQADRRVEFVLQR